MLLGIFIASGFATAIGVIGTAFTANSGVAVVATPSSEAHSTPPPKIDPTLSADDFIIINDSYKHQRHRHSAIFSLGTPGMSHKKAHGHTGQIQGSLPYNTSPPYGGPTGQISGGVAEEGHDEESSGCGDIIRKFNDIADMYVGHIKEAKKVSPFPAGPYDEWDRVGEIGLHVLRQIEIDASNMIRAHGHAATLDETASKHKAEFAKDVLKMCSILRGTFKERLHAHVKRIMEHLDTYAAGDDGYETAMLWLAKEAGFYAHREKSIGTQPMWDAMNDLEARLLRKLYTDTSTELFWATTKDNPLGYIKGEIDELVQNISEGYTRKRQQRNQPR